MGHFARLLNLRDDEARPTLLAAGSFFLVLCGYTMLKPVREAMGVERGMSELRVLFVVTMGVTVLANIALGSVVSRVTRRLLVPIVFRTINLCLVGFFVVLMFLPDAIGVSTGRVFFVWLSVANMFLTSLFWVTITDCFVLEQGKRLFPVMAVGGTLGAFVGALFNRALVETVGVEWFFPGAIVLLEGAIWTLAAVRRSSDARGWRGGGERARRVGGSPWQGITLVLRSPYLMGVVGYILLVAIGHTLLYFATREIVSESTDSRVARSALFANIELLTQGGTLLVQVFVAGRMIRWLGVGVSLAALPAVLIGGFVVLASAPVYAAAALFEAVFRVGKYAVMRPARETLFTVVSDNERLAAKPFIDTFVYRFGDVIGAALPATLAAAAPAAVVWAASGLWLGHRQARRAVRPDQPASASARDAAAS